MTKNIWVWVVIVLAAVLLVVVVAQYNRMKRIEEELARSQQREPEKVTAWDVIAMFIDKLKKTEPKKEKEPAKQ